MTLKKLNKALDKITTLDRFITIKSLRYLIVIETLKYACPVGLIEHFSVPRYEVYETIGRLKKKGYVRIRKAISLDPYERECLAYELTPLGRRLIKPLLL